MARLDSAAQARKAGLASLDAYSLTVDALRTAVDRADGQGRGERRRHRARPEPLTRYCRGCQATHVFELPFRLGALPAGLELEPGTSPPVLVPRAGARPVDGPDLPALQRLIVSYLTMLGPATQADVAGYLEARRADVAEAWPDGLVDVRVDGKPTYLPADRVKTLRKPPEPDLVRLFGAFDPFLQARDRDLIVPDRALHKVLWPVLGRPGVVLVDGEVMGTWRPRMAGKKLTVTVEQFAPLPPATWALIEQEAERVGQVRGAGAVTLARTG